MRVILRALCAAMLCLSCALGADDGVFSAAPGTTPSATAPVAKPATTPTVTTTTVTPAATTTVTTPAPSPDAPKGILDYILGFVTSGAFLAIVAGGYLRLESWIATATKLDVAKGRGLAVTIFQILKDDGFITPNNTTNAMDKFWAEVERQSIEHYGAPATPLMQDVAHAQFADLLHTATSVPAKPPIQTPMIANVKN